MLIPKPECLSVRTEDKNSTDGYRFTGIRGLDMRRPVKGEGM